MPVDETKARVLLAKSDTMAIFTPGVLCKFAERKNRRDRFRGALSPKIVVPNAMPGNIMKTMHNDILNGGHVGVDALSTKITNKYYWKCMYEDKLHVAPARLESPPLILKQWLSLGTDQAERGSGYNVTS